MSVIYAGGDVMAWRTESRNERIIDNLIMSKSKPLVNGIWESWRGLNNLGGSTKVAGALDNGMPMKYYMTTAIARPDPKHVMYRGADVKRLSSLTSLVEARVA